MGSVKVLAERQQGFQVPARLAEPLSWLFALVASKAPATPEASAASAWSSTTIVAATTSTKSAPASVPVAERPANRSHV